MKVWIRRLALIMSLVMLAAACGMAEEIEIDGGQAGEIAPEGAADPEGIGPEGIELEGIELEDMGLEVGGEMPANGDMDLGIDLPDLEGQAVAADDAPSDALAPNYTSTAWGDLQQRIVDATYGDSWITLYEDVYAGDEDGYLVVPAGKDITLDLNGHVLSRGLTEAEENGLVMAVWGTLYILDSSSGYGWITGGNNTGAAGGIYVADGASVTMQGGNIGGNHASRGGGVWVSGGGLFELNDGKITGNEATECAGGVYVTDCATSAGLTTMYGEISGNTAPSGGGVLLYNSIMEMNMKGGKVSDNTAQYGGGVYLSDGASLRMESGTINGNQAEFNGGGVYMVSEANPPSLTMSPGSLISQNQAKLGGGVCSFWGDIAMNGTQISGNHATDAGGVFLQNARMDLKGGSVWENTADNLGGGVAVDKGSTLVMQGGNIFENKAGTGGGVMVTEGGTFELTTEMVSFNTADVAGGVAVATGGKFLISGGSVTGNKAEAGDGGGVYSWVGAEVRMSGGSIGSNEVPSGKAGGGGVFPGTLYVSGTPYIGGNYSGIDYSDCFLGYMEKDAHRIHVTGPLYSGAHIGVDYPFSGPGVYPVTVGLGSDGYLGAFSSNSYDYPVAWNYDHNEAELRPRGTDPQPPAGSVVKLSQCKVSAINDRVYTGKALKPAVTVKCGSKTLRRGTDYTVAYSNNKAVGTAKVTIKGKGNYTGSRTVSFRILPRAMSITKLTAGKGSATVGWSKRAEGGGYQVQYGLKSSFSGAKRVTVKEAGTTRITVKGLTSGKRYYFRVRAYRTVGGKTYYGAWSKGASVTVK